MYYLVLDFSHHLTVGCLHTETTWVTDTVFIPKTIATIVVSFSFMTVATTVMEPSHKQKALSAWDNATYYCTGNSKNTRQVSQFFCKGNIYILVTPCSCVFNLLKHSISAPEQVCPLVDVNGISWFVSWDIYHVTFCWHYYNNRDNWCV